MSQWTWGYKGRLEAKLVGLGAVAPDSLKGRQFYPQAVRMRRPENWNQGGRTMLLLRPNPMAYVY